MINLEKVKYKKCQPSTPPPPPPPPSPQTYTFLRRSAPAPYFHPLFLISQIPLSGRGNQKLFTPALKRGRGGGPNYVIYIQSL